MHFNTKFKLGFCLCGCGNRIRLRSERQILQFFARYHHLKYDNPNKGGTSNPKWKGGRITKLGYVFVLSKDHHFTDGHGYVQEHRLVWEKHNKATLLPWATVHHINEVKTDNRIENLEAMMRYKHGQLHHPKGISLNSKYR